MNENTSPPLSIETLRTGDRAEFARLVEAYYNPLYRLGLKMLGNPQDAEDALQNTFIKALQHIRGFEGRSSLSTWLYRIAANEALMLLRKKRPETSLDAPENDSGGEEDPTPPTEIVDFCCLPESELLSEEGKKQLDLAIASLPAKLRIVFILRDLQDLSIKETAESLNLTETAVKTRLLRARLHLRDQLSAYYRERIPQEPAP